MANKQSFGKVQKKRFQTLNQYVPIVAKVHGDSHPEFHKVRKVFDVINEKIKPMHSTTPELSEDFAELRNITNNYSVPDDVCESYEAVYRLLAELDDAYQTES